MPRRDDIHTVLVLGSGPIVIGQACEFDYSGTQACRVLRQEGYRVVLINSNPATIMTDPDFADRTYVEPLDPDIVDAVIERERPQAILATLGGQTALNLATSLSERGSLDRHGVELIGANARAIRTAEDRQAFKAAMTEIGLSVPASGIAHDLDEALAIAEAIGEPLILRPSFILGGKGTGIAEDRAQFARMAQVALAASPISEVLIERSIKGWKEYELEVMRDRDDNAVVVCSIENLDPMGVHTGDSITVAPAQTLSDVEYQRMRDAAFACIRRIGVETGGSNIQFAIDPATGDMVVIEMNPRVSRSSALASKATGFPIAKIAARLAVGYTLPEIANDITRRTPACFEPTIDYVVTKVPRWAFEKFPGTPAVLGTAMQSVGEAMAIGRTFPESLQKALRSLEHGRAGLNADPGEVLLDSLEDAELVRRASVPTPDRPYQLESALRKGVTVERLARETGVDPWFLDQITRIVEGRERIVAAGGLDGLAPAAWREAKRLGFSDAQVGFLLGEPEERAREARLAAGIRPVFKTVDTCGAEFDAETPYHYSTWEDEDEVQPSGAPRVIILGAGPNRIGQGIEFDYCCVHASFALREASFETVMVNCNPETVSTDYDTSDRLYFEPLTEEDVLGVIDAERRATAEGGGRLAGVIVSLGGQTPLKLASRLPPELVLGTPPEAIDLAEDRRRWSDLCARLAIPQPAGSTAASLAEAREVVERIGYPVLVRPSYVLGGRAMEIVYDDEGLERALAELAGFGSVAGGGAVASSPGPVAPGDRPDGRQGPPPGGPGAPRPGGGWGPGRGGVGAGSLGREGGLSAERPVLVDRFLEDAVEVDVDAIRDGAGEVLIGGVMEHVEEAGVHSGDSACVIPPPTLGASAVEVIEGYTRAIAEALGIKGLVNVQYAVKQGQVFVIEANPRASRTVPFAAKATGIPLAKLAARVMVGATLADLREEGLIPREIDGRAGSGGYVSVKEAVLPFNRFPDVDTLLGPEMRATGEVMGLDCRFGLAFAKSQLAAGWRLPSEGTVFFSLADRDKRAGLGAAARFVELGFRVVATAGTARFLRDSGVPVETVVAKVGVDGDPAPNPGTAPNHGADAVELIATGQVDLVVNTPRGRGPRADGVRIRTACSFHGVPCLTTIAAARAAAAGIADQARHPLSVCSLQELHQAQHLKLSWEAGPEDVEG
jgi:carbamoyl-phosphate synthase large subunit